MNNSQSIRKSRVVLITVGVLWLLVTTLGLTVVSRYESSPGRAATPPARWPADSKLARPTDRATLVLLAHPQCPCTRATIGELELLMARARGLVETYVLFLKPAGFPDSWSKTDLWHNADMIPGVSVIEDQDGVEAARWGAAVSGQAVLYDSEGNLLFHGGITKARGHSGDNAGRSAIVSMLTKGESSRNQTMVFGCPIFGADQEGSESCRKTK